MKLSEPANPILPKNNTQKVKISGVAIGGIATGIIGDELVKASISNDSSEIKDTESGEYTSDISGSDNSLSSELPVTGIVIDVDGDAISDLAIADTDGNGIVDALAVDDSDGNIYVVLDTNNDGIVDALGFDYRGDGNVDLIISDSHGNDVIDAVIINSNEPGIPQTNQSISSETSGIADEKIIDEYNGTDVGILNANYTNEEYQQNENNSEISSGTLIDPTVNNTNSEEGIIEYNDSIDCVEENDFCEGDSELENISDTIDTDDLNDIEDFDFDFPDAII